MSKSKCSYIFMFTARCFHVYIFVREWWLKQNACVLQYCALPRTLCTQTCHVAEDVFRLDALKTHNYARFERSR
jgi:hypothetical protein